MTPFAYLAILISIVLGFGLTELLSRFQQLVHARERVRFHWLPLAWAGIVFVALMQWWWSAFGFRHQLEWNFFLVSCSFWFCSTCDGAGGSKNRASSGRRTA